MTICFGEYEIEIKTKLEFTIILLPGLSKCYAIIYILTLRLFLIL